MRRIRHNILWNIVRVTAVIADFWLNRALEYNRRERDRALAKLEEIGSDD
jgi:hypothetical protein